MVDEANPDNVIIFTDLVNDSICADPRRVEPGQVSQERFPDSMRVLEKGTQNEVKNSNRDLLWQTVNCTPGWPGKDEIPVCLSHTRRARSRSRKASTSA